MTSHWSFGRKIATGFAAVVALGMIVGATSIYALRATITSKDAVLDLATHVLVDCQQLETLAERNMAINRGFLITGEALYDAQRIEARRDVDQTMERLRHRITRARDELLAVDSAFSAYNTESDAVTELKRRGADNAQIAAAFTGPLRQRRQELTRAIDVLVDAEQTIVARLAAESSATSRDAITVVVVVTLLAVALAIALATILTRTLSQQIGGAVSQLQSSSAELHAAANQQAMGAREQATAVTEITTTISELLATSRQIAESAQRVAHMAGQTASSAQTGEQTVSHAHESIAGIQRQVDTIVGHMLELGKKSQQIGTVLQIVSELAEQTNILAINATIEASVAGEAGRRFGVVADEIRKLADRVAGSAKEIRSLIDEVRAAVNTTVMVTETGAKAVEAGGRQFDTVTSSLTQIKSMASTATEAAREIELSTKQQTSAVEQVSSAISNVAQATKETETSSAQTLSTVSQMATLATSLLRLIRPKAT